jgi:hypothetical protein
MVTGIPYDEVLAGFHGDRNTEGLGSHQSDVWLEQLGYAVLRRYGRFYSPLHADRTSPWPCEPFADVHICEVPTGSGYHAIVLMRDGTVLDPNADAPRRLSDYPEVTNIAGIFKVCDPFPSERLVGLHRTYGTGKCRFCGADGESYKYHDPCPGRGELHTP